MGSAGLKRCAIVNMPCPHAQTGQDLLEWCYGQCSFLRPQMHEANFLNSAAECYCHLKMTPSP